MNWYKLAQKLEEVDLKGTLKENDGFIYLNVNEELVKGLFPMIDEKNIQKPPYHQKQYGSIGTHISVMNKGETEDLNVKVKEIGKEYNFQLQDIQSTEPKSWDGVKTVYFVNVKAKELGDLRKKYGLSRKMHDHEFHITIAIEKE